MLSPPAQSTVTTGKYRERGWKIEEVMGVRNCVCESSVDQVLIAFLVRREVQKSNSEYLYCIGWHFMTLAMYRATQF